METLLTERELAERLRLKPETLRRWRHERRGPGWIRVEGAVRYSQDELARFIAMRRFPSERTDEHQQ